MKVAPTPAGSEKAVRSAKKFPELPEPLPRFTVTVYVTLPAAGEQSEPDWAPSTTDPTLGESVNVVCAVRPEVSPTAFKVNVVPRS